MGKPGRGNARSPVTEYIGGEERTRGTETSQYPEEEKEISMPIVAASELGPAQTMLSVIGGSLSQHGVVGFHREIYRSPRSSALVVERTWKDRP